jgi:hypothetical protein
MNTSKLAQNYMGTFINQSWLRRVLLLRQPLIRLLGRNLAAALPSRVYLPRFILWARHSLLLPGGTSWTVLADGTEWSPG